MRRNVIETVMGAVVLAVAGFFLFFAYTTSSVRSGGGYPLEARFSSTGGLQAGAQVRVSGVKVGTVTSQTLDRQTFQAVLLLEIDPSVQLPEDTTAAIASESLLGGRFVDLQPGGAPDLLKPGGRIQYTQSAVNLEDLLGRFMFNAGGGGQGGPQGGGPDASPSGGNAPDPAGAQPSGSPPSGNAPAAKPGASGGLLGGGR